MMAEETQICRTWVLFQLYFTRFSLSVHWHFCKYQKNKAKQYYITRSRQPKSWCASQNLYKL